MALAANGRRAASPEGQSRADRRRIYQRVLLELSCADDSDWGALVRTAVELVAETLKIDRVGVWLFNPDYTAIFSADVFHRDQNRHEDGYTLRTVDCPHYFAALTESRAVAATNAMTDPRTAELADSYLRPSGMQSLLDVPIRRRDKLIGILCHEHGEVREWSPEEQEFVASVSDRVALALEATRRRDAELALMRANESLERKVAERTAEVQRLSDDLRERAHELESINAELRSFTYSVSHDLRAPLRAITGFGQILARRHQANLNEEGRHYLENVLEAAGRMSRLIEDLLAYARLGRHPIALRDLELTHILAPIVRDLAARLAESHGRIDVPLELPTVRGDATLLTQLFQNLLDNAIKYHRPGVPPEVTVRASIDAGRAIVTVADNGIGIAPEHHAKIFQVFQRLHGDGEYPGSGIGLAAVKKAADRLGGSVRLESTPGVGSRFIVELPATIPTFPEAQ